MHLEKDRTWLKYEPWDGELKLGQKRELLPASSGNRTIVLTGGLTNPCLRPWTNFLLDVALYKNKRMFSYLTKQMCIFAKCVNCTAAGVPLRLHSLFPCCPLIGCSYRKLMLLLYLFFPLLLCPLWPSHQTHQRPMRTHTHTHAHARTRILPQQRDSCDKELFRGLCLPPLFLCHAMKGIMKISEFQPV